MNIAKTLDIAVRLTESAMLPFAKAEKKFEILPPGQAATSIIPRAKLGLGSSIQIRMKVRNGKTKN
jgi:hypothetical protein